MGKTINLIRSMLINADSICGYCYIANPTSEHFKEHGV